MSKKISELTGATDLSGSELVPVVQSGSTVKSTVQDIANKATLQTLQQTLDAQGETALINVNTINVGGSALKIVSGDLSEAAQYTKFLIDNTTISLEYQSSDATGGGLIQLNSDFLRLKKYDAVNSTELRVTPALATINKNNAGANEIVTVNMLPQVANDFADDTAAATGGIIVGGLYHTAGAVRIRLT